MNKVTESPSIFIHGQESSSRGTKGVYFRQNFPEMIIPDFVGSLSGRMEELDRILKDKKNMTIIGSSLGGIMAAIFAFQNREKVKKLILLAPALNLDEFKPYLSERLNVPVRIYHGKHDELIPPSAIKDIAGKVFSDYQFTLLEDDHRLSKTFTSIDWHGLLTG